MDRLADLGIRGVRLPVLWERTAPHRPPDWAWSDHALARLEARGVDAIVGLVHHGGGPAPIHLLDPAFVSGLVTFARSVAERYPHVQAYTPVNEPLTTARFSALYGVWHPHARDPRSWWTALKHQLMATVLSMDAIREVQPAAQLVQTEDLGRVFSTPALRDQAAFENERRWLSFDLLLGRVDDRHPLYRYLLSVGATKEELRWFVERPCPPDLLGLNVYVTSERFLDEHLDHYPERTHGGNHRQRYADVEAVRVMGARHGGPGARLMEAHERYGMPMAITEVQLHCTREEQMRWLHGAWQGALAAHAAGADVRAVTVWAAYGAFEWHSLLTRRDGHYESGLFDIRGACPRPTAMARLAQALAHGTPVPVLARGVGWWARPERLLYPSAGPVEGEEPAGPPLLVLGRGPLTGPLRRACDVRGLRHTHLPRWTAQSLAQAARSERPWAAALCTSAVSVRAARQVAALCAALKIPLLVFSSPLVFAGTPGHTWTETDTPVPSTRRGQQLLRVERLTQQLCPDTLIVRAGPTPEAVMTSRQSDDAVMVTPVRQEDLIRCALDLLVDGEAGVWHLAEDTVMLPFTDDGERGAWSFSLGTVRGQLLGNPYGNLPHLRDPAEVALV